MRKPFELEGLTMVNLTNSCSSRWLKRRRRTLVPAVSGLRESCLTRLAKYSWDAQCQEMQHRAGLSPGRRAKIEVICLQWRSVNRLATAGTQWEDGLLRWSRFNQRGARCENFWLEHLVWLCQRREWRKSSVFAQEGEWRFRLIKRRQWLTGATD